MNRIRGPPQRNEGIFYAFSVYSIRNAEFYEETIHALGYRSRPGYFWVLGFFAFHIAGGLLHLLLLLAVIVVVWNFFKGRRGAS